MFVEEQVLKVIDTLDFSFADKSDNAIALKRA